MNKRRRLVVRDTLTPEEVNARFAKMREEREREKSLARVIANFFRRMTDHKPKGRMD
jgi:hypothetical protein